MKAIRIISISIVLLTAVLACGNVDEHVGEVQPPMSSSNLKGSNYIEVQEKFIEEGFTNIKLVKIEDLITGWLTDDGEVEDVSVGGEIEYSSSQWYSPDTEVIIRYHTFAGDSEMAASDVEVTELTKPTEIKSQGGNVGEKSEATVTQPPSPIESEPTLQPSPTPIEVAEDSDSVLTIENSEDLLTMLLSGDYEDYREFADKYEGRKIEFDGSIDYFTNHENYNSRYDILISAWDYNPNSQDGPTFKLEDVGISGDGLDLPSLSVGLNVHIIAEVVAFDWDRGIFYLDLESLKQK